VSSVFWNCSWFEDAVTLAQKFGVKRSEWFDAMLPAMENGPEPVRQFLGNFVRDTIGELFPTREACIEFYRKEENFRRLVKGDIGDNLMYRYRALASFYLWPEVCDAAMAETKRLLLERGAAAAIPQFEEFWSDFGQFQLHQHAHGTTVEQILSLVEFELRYDVARWIAEGMPLDVAAYRLERPALFRFQVTEEGARELAAGFEVWTPTLLGLTKMVTRIQMSWQVRKCQTVEPRESCVLEEVGKL